VATYGKTVLDQETVQVSVTASIGEQIWENFARVTSAQKQAAQSSSTDKWGVTPADWYIYRAKGMKQYAPVYEFLHESAERHALSSEFLHAVVMGEGLHLFIEDLRASGARYSPSQAIDAFQYLGADEIGVTIDELIDNGYIEQKHKGNITPQHAINELGENKVSATITGFETAIEVVAAELHSRRDWILDHVRTNALAVDTSDTDAVDFLTYAAYNNQSVAVEAAVRITQYMRVYTRAERTDQRNVRFNTLKRLSTADWYKAARVYEI